MFSWLNIRIGFFLAVRQIRRASLWTTGLIVFVMVLTFLNLVVSRGILVGLVQGLVNAQRVQYTGDIIISNLDEKKYIENTPEVISIIKSLPQVDSLSARFRLGGSVEANYTTKKITDRPNIASGVFVGIDPLAEEYVTGFSKSIIEGEPLLPTDYDKVIIGSFLLKQYSSGQNPGITLLDNVAIGSKVRINVNGVEREVTVKGILKSKVQEISMNVYMVDSQLRNIIGRNDGNVGEIAVKLKPGADPVEVKRMLVLSGVEKFGKVQTYVEAQSKFMKDVVATFSMLGSVLSSIGLIVASITIFIVIFINAITRRKFIGILKGIGIDGKAIEISYVFQSIFYAICGSIFGLALVYGFMVPFFIAHPINYPFSDGILVAPVNETVVRMGLLVLATVIAGYVPSRLIVRKNTLDAILGRG